MELGRLGTDAPKKNWGTPLVIAWICLEKLGVPMTEERILCKF